MIHSDRGNLQPAVVQLTDTHLVAYCRRAGDYKPTDDGWMVRAESHDGGFTWTRGIDSKFPNPNAAIDFKKLANGHLLLVYNDHMSQRAPLTVAISTDHGVSFPHRKNLAEGPGSFSYPTAIQTRDGKITLPSPPMHTPSFDTQCSRKLPSFPLTSLWSAAACRRFLLSFSIPRIWRRPGSSALGDHNTPCAGRAYTRWTAADTESGISSFAQHRDFQGFARHQDSRVSDTVFGKCSDRQKHSIISLLSALRSSAFGESPV